MESEFLRTTFGCREAGPASTVKVSERPVKEAAS
jgi:hypothetical protein